MNDIDKEKEAELKKAIFDSMSPKRQKHILKKGYDKWEPFEKPKDPIDMRMDKTRRTTQMLIREFLQQEDLEQHGNDYRRGAFDLCLGIINEDERYMGMFAFARWYAALLDRENVDIEEGS